MEQDILKVINLDRYKSYREIIAPLMKAYTMYKEANNIRKDTKFPEFIEVYNTRILPAMCKPNKPNLDFSRHTYLQKELDTLNVGAVYLDGLFDLGARDICRAFSVQIIVYKGSFNFAKVFLLYADFMPDCMPALYLGENAYSNRRDFKEGLAGGGVIERFLVICNSVSKGRNVLFTQDSKGYWVLKDLKKNTTYSEDYMTSAFVQSANALIKHFNKPIHSVYCVFNYTKQGSFNNEVSAHELNGELVLTFFYGRSL